MEFDDEVQRLQVALRVEGWADFVTLDRELRVWKRLAEAVNTYTATVDDYTNDLCSRDYLAALTARASARLQRSLGQLVVPIDELFRTATADDADGRLGRYYRIELNDGWWWNRRPSSGPLAHYLTGHD